MDFGFTNDAARIEAAKRWRDAAIADGWSHEPTYGEHESEDSACKLRKDGWVAMVISRTYDGKEHWIGQASVNVWAPDELAVQPPNEYDWNALQEHGKKCMRCGGLFEETHRVGFAGRSCEGCLPELRKTHERPGWTM